MQMFKPMKPAVKALMEKYRKAYRARINKALLIHDFSILSNSCTAGIILHDLHLKFTTPTIDLYFVDSNDFIHYCKNLKAYSNASLVEKKEQ